VCVADPDHVTDQVSSLFCMADTDRVTYQVSSLIGLGVAPLCGKWLVCLSTARGSVLGCGHLTFSLSCGDEEEGEALVQSTAMKR
jgi:hypothetical protein